MGKNRTSRSSLQEWGNETAFLQGTVTRDHWDLRGLRAGGKVCVGREPVGSVHRGEASRGKCFQPEGSLSNSETAKWAKQCKKPISGLFDETIASHCLFLFVFFFSPVLEIKPKTSHMWGKHSTTEPQLTSVPWSSIQTWGLEAHSQPLKHKREALNSNKAQDRKKS